MRHVSTATTRSSTPIAFILDLIRRQMLAYFNDCTLVYEDQCLTLYSGEMKEKQGHVDCGEKDLFLFLMELQGKKVYRVGGDVDLEEVWNNLGRYAGRDRMMQRVTFNAPWMPGYQKRWTAWRLWHK